MKQDNEYIKLIKAMASISGVIESVHEHNEQEEYAIKLFMKFGLHAMTVYNLSRGIRIPELEIETQNCDFGSMFAIARSAYECSLRFYFTFIGPKSQDEKDYRFYNFILSGEKNRRKSLESMIQMRRSAIERLNMNLQTTLDPEVQKKYISEIDEINTGSSKEIYK